MIKDNTIQGRTLSRENSAEKLIEHMVKQGNSESTMSDSPLNSPRLS